MRFMVLYWVLQEKTKSGGLVVTCEPLYTTGKGDES